MTQIIRITADRPGLNRGGIVHPEGPTDYPAADISAPQLEHLELEPWLKVERIDTEATKPVTAKPLNKKGAPKPDEGSGDNPDQNSDGAGKVPDDGDKTTDGSDKKQEENPPV